MEQSKDDTWKKILHIIITILTAIAASLTTQSCIKHKTIQTRESYPMVTLAAMPETTPTVLYTLQGFTQEEVVLLKQLIEHEREGAGPLPTCPSSAEEVCLGRSGRLTFSPLGSKRRLTLQESPDSSLPQGRGEIHP